jgi:hypothetical protein
MLLNRQRANSSDGVVVHNSGFDDEAGLPRAGISGTDESARISKVPRTSRGPGSKDHLRFGVTSAAGRPVRWTWRDVDDRKVFNVWALWVVVFYASLAVVLLAAMSSGIGR